MRPRGGIQFRTLVLVRLRRTINNDEYGKENVLNNTPTITNLVNEAEAARRLGLKPRGLQGLRQSGRGPKFVRISRGCIRYRPEDLDDWISERLADSTSDVTVAEEKTDA